MFIVMLSNLKKCYPETSSAFYTETAQNTQKRRFAINPIVKTKSGCKLIFTTSYYKTLSWEYSSTSIPHARFNYFQICTVPAEAPFSGME